MQERYLGKFRRPAAQLLGPYYALLQPEYEKLYDDTPARAGAIRRVFVFISGGDVDNLTGMALRAALRVLRDDMFMDVVMTASHPLRGRKFACLASTPAFRFIRIFRLWRL